jgi:hypothetical protein
MKKLFFTLLTSITLISFGQAPQQISYQGVARNTTGSVLSNQNIGIKLDLHQGSAAGAVVFSETHNKTTNSFGLFTLGIGSVNSGVFTGLNWAAGPYFLEVSIDPAGGTSYTSVGTQQFMSVPYALYAETSGNAGSTPTITINAPNTVTSSAGSYTINIPAITSYTAGPGIDITSGIISNTATAVTPTITGAGSATVTSSGNTFTVTTPATTTYTAGSGIDITGGIISNTATAITPTITGAGSATVISSGNTFTVNTPALTSPTITSTGIAVVTPTTGNVFNVDVPVPVLSYTPGTSVLSISQGTTVSTATLVGAGTNTIDIVGSGLATVTPTTGSTFTVSVPNPTLTINSGSLSISNGNTIALPEQSLSINSNSLTISGTGGNTVVLPSASTTTLTQGNNINLTGTAPNYTISAVTPTLTGAGTTTITGTYPNYTVSSASSPSTSISSGTNILVSGSSPDYTISAVTPTLTGAGTTTITGTYPSYTVSSASSPSTAISSGTNVVVTGAYPNYTVSSTTPSLSVVGGSLTGTYPTQTLTIPTQTTYVGTANNISVTSNTINLIPTGVTSFSYGANVSNAVPTFSVDTYGRLTSAGQYTPTVNGDVLGTINTSTVVKLQGVPVSTIAPTANQMLKFIGGAWTPTTAVQTASYVSQGVVSVINAAPLYTINVPMSTYNNNTGVFGTGPFTIAVTPTLTLAGNTLRSGPTTNTVSLPTPTVVSGNANITVTPTGNIYSVSAVTPTLSVAGGVLTGTYPTQTLTIPTNSTTVLTSTNITITGTAPNYTLSSPSQSLSVSGNSLSITGGNTVTVPTSTVLAGNGNITVAPAGNVYSVSAPSYSISLPGGNVVQITNGVNTSTAAIATTSLTLTGANNNILSAGGNTVGLNTYTAGTGISLTGTAPNYTLSSPNQSLTINSNSLSITGGNTVTIPTATIVSTNTNISVSSSAGVFSLTAVSPTLSGDVVGAVNTTTVTHLQTRPVSNAAPIANQVLTWNGAAWTPSSTVVPILSYTGSATAGTLQSGAQTVTIPNYTLSNTSNTISLNNGTANSTAIIPVPTLTLVGSTLQSGPSSNTVSLSGIGGIYGGSGSIQTGSTTVTVGTNTLTFLSGNTANKSIANFFGGGITGTHLAVGHTAANASGIRFLGSVATTPVDYGYVSGSANGIAISGGTSSNGLYATNAAEIGVGTFTTGTGKFVITHTASQANPTMHLRETTGGLNRIKFSNNTVPNKFFETAAQTNAINANGAYSINYFDGTTYNPVLLVTGERKVNINNLNTVLSSLHVMENSTTAGGGIVSEGFGEEGQINILRNNQAGIGVRTAVSASEILGRVNFSGYNGTTFNPGAEIYGMSTEAQTGSNGGTELNFRVTPNGTIISQDLFKLGSDGTVAVNPNNSFSGALLDVKGRLRVDSSLTMRAYNIAPNTSNINEGRIYYDRPTNKFKVSENGGAYVDLIGGGASAWIQGTGIVTQATINDRVGIGTNTPAAQLTIANSFSASEGVFVDNNTTNNGMRVFQAGTGNAFFAHIANLSGGSGFAGISNSSSALFSGQNTGAGGAADFSINNSSNTSVGLQVSTNGGGSAMAATNFGSGTAGIISISSATNTSTSLEVNSAGTGTSLFAVNTNASVLAYAGNFDGGLIVKGKTSASADYAFKVSNSTSEVFGIKNNGNIGINILNPIYKVHINSSNTVAALYSENSVTGSFSNAHGIFGKVASSNTNALAAGVFANNAGAGPSIFASKGATDVNGIAGRFEIQNTANTADAVFVENDGRGAAIHAVSGPTVTGSSNVGLWLEDGHLKATGTNATSSTTVTSISTSTVIGNDVVGKISITTVATAIPANQEMIRVQFAKSYPAGVTPNIIITPSNANAAGVQGYVSTVSNTGFSLFFNVGTAAIIRTYTFNYMVIE